MTVTEAVLRPQSSISAQVTCVVVFLDQFGVIDKEGRVSVGISDKRRSSQVSVPVVLFVVTFRRDTRVLIFCSVHSVYGDHTVN